MKRIPVYLMAMLFLAGLIISSVGVTNTPTHLQETIAPKDITHQQNYETSWLPVDRKIRVAIYNESDTTAPSYATDPGLARNNYSAVQNVLVSSGYEVTLLSTNDIYYHALTTADYDVFVIVDQFPKDNITSQIIDFWEGGGSLLTFDGAAGFLTYFGILPPEAAGTSGKTDYWYYTAYKVNVTARHPVSRNYEVNDTIDTMSGYLSWNYTALQETSIASDLTMVARSNLGPAFATVLAYDPTTVAGGKVVTFAPDMGAESLPGLHQMISDAVEWLCPTPKARVAFDYTHNPYYGVEIGDPSRYPADRYAEYRDVLVQRGYTFDKLYPSVEGNLTTERLAPYDMLIINTPQINFTAAEATAVRNWVANGGGLFAIGDGSTFNNDDLNLNYLIGDSDLTINISANYVTSSFTTTDGTNHPITEYISTLYFDLGKYINVSGDAEAIWYDNTDVTIGSLQVGNGRIILLGDINVLSTNIAQNDNRQLGINIANWLTSGSAEVLLHVNEPWSINYYKTPVVNAINKLGIQYYLTSNFEYYNISLNRKSWNMVIVDAPWFEISGEYCEETAQYVEEGGHLLVSNYYVNDEPDNRLWPLLGFNFTAEMPDSQPLHIWDAGHPIFNSPYEYGADNFTPVLDYGDEGDILNVFDNATALAGLGSTPQDNQSVIVLGNEGRTLYNGYLIDEFSGDLDDSTYADNFELWMNEIAFMMRPTIDSPSDMNVDYGSTGVTLTWTPQSDRPYRYTIERDSSEITNDEWNGATISVVLDGYDIGQYIFEVTVWDTAGYTATDTVTVTVANATTTTSTTSTTTTTGTTTPGDMSNLLTIIIVGAVGAVVIIIIIIVMKKR